MLNEEEWKRTTLVSIEGLRLQRERDGSQGGFYVVVSSKAMWGFVFYFS